MRYLLNISFDGTDFHGWQVQPNALTVQDTLQDSFEAMLNERIGVTGCSRTDAGVHANMFCCHFDYKELPCIAFVKGLNAHLPNSIRVNACKEVGDDFHARYSALYKNYIYKVNTNEIVSPFDCRYTFSYTQKLNFESIDVFCELICGTHDFVGFSSSGRTAETTVRTVESFNYKKDNGIITFSITADGFLYNMVRIIVGTALKVGTESLNKEEILKIIKSCDRTLAGITAPPQGLFLNKVVYRE